MTTVIKAAAAYWFLLFAVRLVGRRTVSMMAPFDLIVLFLFGGATLTAVLDDDHSLVAAISVIFTIGLMHVVVTWLKARVPAFGRIVDGTPVVVFERGRWHEHRMQRLRMQPIDIMTAVRQRGLHSLSQVRYAVAERDGKISIIEETE